MQRHWWAALPVVVAILLLGYADGMTGYYSAADFAVVAKRDAHVHLNTLDPSLILQAAEDNFSVITINTDAAHFPMIDDQEDIAVAHRKAFPGRVAYAATFSVAGFGKSEWLQETTRHLAASFRRGAIAVKFWKNIGMELRDADNRFVMIDNPAFDPLITFITSRHVTMIGHLGEPKNSWLPLKEMTVSSDRAYYAQRPEYHMYLHPQYPSYDQQVQASYRMLQKHPEVTFVGAHLASLEWSVEELAKRLDRFPNMAVDIAARMPHLEYQARRERGKVRRFMLRYQDRLIYGTDQAATTSQQPAAVRAHAHEVWTRDWRFLTSADTMTAPQIDGTFQGLRLPREVIDKVYRFNSERWYGFSTGEGHR